MLILLVFCLRIRMFLLLALLLPDNVNNIFDTHDPDDMEITHSILNHGCSNGVFVELLLCSYTNGEKEWT